jgi:hypothetical protein
MLDLWFPLVAIGAGVLAGLFLLPPLLRGLRTKPRQVQAAESRRETWTSMLYGRRAGDRRAVRRRSAWHLSP